MKGGRRVQQELTTQTVFFRKRSKNRKLWKRIVTGLASVVVFCTTYALILPAITMEGYVCGVTAHQHDENCYAIGPPGQLRTLVCDGGLSALHQHEDSCYTEGVLTCGYADYILHRHTGDCRDGEGRLICPLPEIAGHLHDESCWQQPHVHGTDCYTWQQGQLLCTIEEGAVHTHDDSCRVARQELVCTQAEGPGHTHGGDCFPQVLICGLAEDETHRHDDGCVAIADTPQCGLEAGPGHTHGDTCLQTVYDLSCPLEEGVPHVHGDDCWERTQVLTCQQLTAEEGVQPQLICGQEQRLPHIHDDTCLNAAGALCCGLLQTEEHTHGSLCFVITETAGEPSLCCGMEVHTHGPECLPPEEDPQPGLWADGRTCGMAEHQHGPECLDEYGALWCTIPEHTHWELCDLDPNKRDTADPDDSWLDNQPIPTGDPAADTAAVALAQVGYRESDAYYTVTDEAELRWYSRYADWWDGDGFSDWNAKLAAFCLETAGVTEVPLSDSAAHWPALLAEAELWQEASAARAEAGRLAFFDGDGDGRAESVGIITEAEAESGGFTAVLEQNGRVREKHYASAPTTLLGVGLLERETAAPTLSQEEVLLPEHFFYEDELLSMQLTVTGIAKRPEDAVVTDEAELPEPELAVLQLEEDDPRYWPLMEAIAEQCGDTGLMGLSAMELQFRQGPWQLDASDCTIEAEITLKDTMLATAAEVYDEAAPEAEVGVEVAVLQTADGTEIQTDTALFALDEPRPALTVPVNNGVLAVAASQTANPHFTVQYYANIPTLQWGEEASRGVLKIINTEGNEIPENGKSPALKYLKLTENKSVLRELEQRVVYAEMKYEYIKAPNMTYFNRLFENGHYQLKEIWVQNGVELASGETGEDEWKVYTDLNNIHFTNRPESATGTRILIDDNTIIRLVYDATSEATYKNDVNFFDYDITNGKIYGSESDARAQSNPISAASANKRYYMLSDNMAGTGQQGINLASNYQGTGTKLAFGNSNTRVKLGIDKWNDQQLNKYNTNNSAAGGCTFGIAKALTEDGSILYADGIAVPDLFGESAAQGKTPLSGYTLEFDRVGDTYTLKTIYDDEDKIVDDGLNIFTERDAWDKKSKIYANDFWPLDRAYRRYNGYANGYAPGHDMMFGKTNDQHTFVGAPYKVSDDNNNTTGREGNPKSDDEIDHNAYFGMHYAVKFTLTNDYVGPLEYLFFGDDDMWVFLSPADENGTLTGEGKLVCDIGGVHSSVGEYVNLWDYIDKSELMDDKPHSYVLNFFYTERGASGSSCYMQFTLPSVASATPTQTTGSLKVEKQVSGAVTDTRQEYQFHIELEKALDDYRYTRYDAEGNEVGHDLILHDGTDFTLTAGQYIVIDYLPAGTKYTVSEVTEENGFKTTYQINSGTVEAGQTATATIGAGDGNTVTFVNTYYYELPETGGGGAGWYYAAGALLCAAAGLLLVWQSRRKGDAPPS